jgi:hypothetical protein
MKFLVKATRQPEEERSKRSSVSAKDVDGMFRWSQQHSFQFQTSVHIRPKNRKTYSNLKRLVMSRSRQLGHSKGNWFRTSTATKFQSLVLVCILQWEVKSHAGLYLTVRSEESCWSVSYSEVKSHAGLYLTVRSKESCWSVSYSEKWRVMLVCILQWEVKCQSRIGDPASFVHVSFHHHRNRNVL